MGASLRSYGHLERLARVLEMKWPAKLPKWLSGSCFLNVRTGIYGAQKVSSRRKNVMRGTLKERKESALLSRGRGLLE